jgi:hypothetical protein
MEIGRSGNRNDAVVYRNLQASKWSEPRGKPQANADHVILREATSLNFSRVYLRWCAVAVAAGLAAGCADLGWHKPGTTQAAADEDLERCRQNARLRASQEAVPSLVSPPMRSADPQGRPVAIQSSPRDTERSLVEQHLTSACMRTRGYELVPREKR